MNKEATKHNFDDRCISVAKWCRKHGFSYSSTNILLNRNSKIMETRKQQAIIAALISDGLYVASEEDGK
jgi:hypothetical protein